MQLRILSISIMAILSAYSIINAKELNSVTLSQSIVSISRIDTAIDEAPGNVSVVSQKDIALRPNRKFSDTLRGYEGLQQSKSRGMDTFDSVRIRGLSGAAIMVDGIILNDINNNTKMLTAMDSSDIAQVEVVRGAFSNIYGSGAVAGAINFITTMPTAFSAKAIFGYGNALGTSFAPKNTFHSFMSIGDALLDKRLRLKASLGITTSQGYAADSVVVADVSGYQGAKPTLDSNSGALRYNIGDMGAQAYTTYDSSLKAELDTSDNGTLSGYLRWNMYQYDHKNQSTFMTQNGIPSYGNNADVDSGKPAPILYGRNIGKEAYAQLISSLNYKHYLPHDSHIEVKFYNILGWDRFNNPDGGINPTNANTSIYGGDGSQTNHKYQTNNLDMLYALSLNESHKILVGAQYRHNHYTQQKHYIENWKDMNATLSDSPTSGYKQGGKTQAIGVFTQWQGDWNKYLRGFYSNISVRYDYWQGYGIYKDNDIYSNNTKQTLSPKISLNFTPHTLTRFKLSFGEAFKAPTFAQMFSNRNLTDGTAIKGNPNLKPENVLSFDIGIEQDIPMTFNTQYGIVKMYYFNNTTSNAIMQYSSSYFNPTLRGAYDNLGKNRIQGIESSLSLPVGYGINVHITYTFMDSVILKSLEKSTEGNKVAGVPSHLAYSAISYDGSKIYGSFGVEYASKPYKNADNKLTPSGIYGATDSYTIADIKLGWKINKHFEMGANITNLFNHTYYSYYRASGRAFFFSIEGRI
ncbi:TonB-dependent receptor [uncultured Helicobacter sp.]|uniref:TonB-dependent receptor n=1 Tax=uncultured Helicobacter sp. TaxID=175537 RepID=UPI00263B7081|nr:TonB-dependent receptor [uncultured Helicobacter sp.]